MISEGGVEYWNDWIRDELRERYDRAMLPPPPAAADAVVGKCGGVARRRHHHGNDDDERLLSQAMRDAKAERNELRDAAASAKRLAIEVDKGIQAAKAARQNAAMEVKRVAETAMKPRFLDFGKVLLDAVRQAFAPPPPAAAATSEAKPKSFLASLHSSVVLDEEEEDVRDRDELQAQVHLETAVYALKQAEAQKVKMLKAHCDAVIERRFSGGSDRIKLVMITSASMVALGEAPVYALRALSTATAKRQWCSSQQTATIEQWCSRLDGDAALDEEVQQLLEGRCGGGGKARRG